MKKIKIILLSFILIILSFLLFNKFMTYDRPHATHKSFVDNFSGIEKLSGFKIISWKQIDPKLIKLSKIKKTRVAINKFSNYLNYSTPKAYEYKIVSDKKSESIIFRLYIMGDHIHGINVRFLNYELNDENKLFNSINKKFERINVYKF